MSNPHRKALVKLIQTASHHRHTWDVFSDFVEMSAISLANAVDIRFREAREARYMAIVKRYDKDTLALFPEMLAELIEALTLEPADILGSVFMELELGNHYKGQFFTPYHLCRLMARVTLGDGEDARAKIQRNGFITCQEPASGAGAMLMAFAEEMENLKMNPQQELHITAIDVDPRAAHMCYVQLTLLHLPAVVIVGNALTLEQQECWYTPAHLLGLWDGKIQRGYTMEAQSRLEEEDSVEAAAREAGDFA